MKRFVLLDSNALMHRAYHALPPLKTKKGQLINAVYGFISILFRLIQDLRPDYLAASFDLAGPTFRDLAYQDYKAKRIKPAQEFYDQLPLVKKLIKAINIPIYEKQGFEADDIIGTIVLKLNPVLNTGQLRIKRGAELKTIIISGDLDILQLVNKKTEVHVPKKGISEMVIYNQAAIKERYGLTPEQIPDFKGLKGDASDNIPGVPGIGEKIAIGLIKKFSNLEKLYQSLERDGLNPKLKAKLLEYKEQAFFSRYLATIKKDAPIDFNLDDCRWGKFNRQKVIELLEDLEFHSLIKRLPVV